MRIVINGESRDVPAEYRLDQLLAYFSMPAKRVAVELNGRVTRRIEWEATVIREDDRIEVVHFVGGG